MKDYGSMLARIRTLVRNRLSISQEKSVAEVSDETEDWYDEDWTEDIGAVSQYGRCHNCGGSGIRPLCVGLAVCINHISLRILSSNNV